MRELIFKNLTSPDKKRKDLYISETSEKNGIKTVTQRHSIYIIGERAKVNTAQQLLQHTQKDAGHENKRHIFVFKKRNTKLKKDTFICDVVGKFYAVIKDEIYPIAFKHSFEIDFFFKRNGAHPA